MYDQWDDYYLRRSKELGNRVEEATTVETRSEHIEQGAMEQKKGKREER